MEAQARGEPLCRAPVGCAVVELDEDEQRAVDIELRRWTRSESEFETQLLNITGIDWNDERANSSLANHISNVGRMDAYRWGLKTLAYNRYHDGQPVLAAQTCIKALCATGVLKQSRWQRHRGKAELWLLLAHMHAYAGKFRIAKDLSKRAKQVAKHDDELVGVGQALWSRAVTSLETAVRTKKPPAPTSYIFFFPEDHFP